MKCEDVVIGQDLNEQIWVRGIKNPPGKVSVVVLKTQINGSDKVIVDLTQEGVDAQLALYNTTTAPVASEETKEEVKDAEVKEVESKKEDSKKEEAKEK